MNQHQNLPREGRKFLFFFPKTLLRTAVKDKQTLGGQAVDILKRITEHICDPTLLRTRAPCKIYEAFRCAKRK